MTAKWKKAVLAVVLTSGVIAAPVYAGFKGGNTVTVDPVNRFGRGSLGNARNSGDTTQYIGCDSAAYAGTSSVSGSCNAVDASYVSVSCLTQDPGLLAQIRSIGMDSYIYFAFDASGNCTTVQVDHHSYHAPKGL